MLAQTVKHGDSNAMVMGKIPSTKVLINVHFKCSANLFLLKASSQCINVKTLTFIFC